MIGGAVAAGVCVEYGIRRRGLVSSKGVRYNSINHCKNSEKPRN